MAMSGALRSAFRSGSGGLRKRLQGMANRQQLERGRTSAVMDSGARTAALAVTAGAAGYASGRLPEWVEMKGYDVRLPAGVLVALLGARRLSKGKRGTGTAVLSGVADGLIASYASEKGLRAGEKALKEKAASEAAAAAPTAAPASAVPVASGESDAKAVRAEVRRLTWTDEPAFGADRRRGLTRARSLADI